MLGGALAHLPCKAEDLLVVVGEQHRRRARRRRREPDRTEPRAKLEHALADKVPFWKQLALLEELCMAGIDGRRDSLMWVRESNVDYPWKTILNVMRRPSMSRRNCYLAENGSTIPHSRAELLEALLKVELEQPC